MFPLRCLSRPLDGGLLLRLVLFFSLQAALFSPCLAICGQPSTVISNLVVTPSNFTAGQSVNVTWAYSQSSCALPDANSTTLNSTTTIPYPLLDINFVLTCGTTPSVNVTNADPAKLFVTFKVPAEFVFNCTGQLLAQPTTPQSVILAKASITVAANPLIPTGVSRPPNLSNLTIPSEPVASALAASPDPSFAQTISKDAPTTVPAPLLTPNGGLSITVIVGAAVGAGVLIFVIVALTVVSVRRRRVKRVELLWREALSKDLEKRDHPPPPQDHYYTPPKGKKKKGGTIRQPRASSMDIVAYASGHVDDSPPTSKSAPVGGTLGKYYMAPARQSTPSIIAYGTEAANPDQDAIAKYRIDSPPPTMTGGRPPNSRRK